MQSWQKQHDHLHRKNIFIETRFTGSHKKEEKARRTEMELQLGLQFLITEVDPRLKMIKF